MASIQTTSLQVAGHQYRLASECDILIVVKVRDTVLTLMLRCCGFQEEGTAQQMAGR